VVAAARCGAFSRDPEVVGFLAAPFFKGLCRRFDGRVVLEAEIVVGNAACLVERVGFGDVLGDLARKEVVVGFRSDGLVLLDPVSFRHVSFDADPLLIILASIAHRLLLSRTCLNMRSCLGVARSAVRDTDSTPTEP
jgi:hypothetical protein